MIEQEQFNEIMIDGAKNSENYYSVSTFKFLLMYVGTFGLFNIYWQYKNWQYLKCKMSLDIMPFWRAFFSPLWVFSLFKYVYASAESKEIKTILPSISLASLYFLLSIFWRLPDPYWMISFLTVIPLLIVNSVVIEINGTNGFFKPNSHLSIWQWILVLIGASFLSIIIYIIASGESVEEFAFKNTLQRDLISKCANEAACINSVKSQITPCMEKSNWEKFIDNQNDESEVNRFITEFYGCIVDEDGDPLFIID